MKCKNKGCNEILQFRIEKSHKACISCITGYKPRGISKGNDLYIEPQEEEKYPVC